MPTPSTPSNHFGRMFSESLKENRPEEYRALEESGELAKAVEAVEQRAEAQYHDLLAQLQHQHPAPKDADYPARVQHTMGLAQQARELVLNELVVPSAEDEADNNQTDPYASGNPTPLSR